MKTKRQFEDYITFYMKPQSDKQDFRMEATFAISKTQTITEPIVLSDLPKQELKIRKGLTRELRQEILELLKDKESKKTLEEQITYVGDWQKGGTKR